MGARKWRLTAPGPATRGGPTRPPRVASWGVREAPIPWKKVAHHGPRIPRLAGAQRGPREWRVGASVRRRFLGRKWRITGPGSRGSRGPRLTSAGGGLWRREAAFWAPESGASGRRIPPPAGAQRGPREWRGGAPVRRRFLWRRWPLMGAQCRRSRGPRLVPTSGGIRRREAPFCAP